jgi:uncharacterized membrane protein
MTRVLLTATFILALLPLQARAQEHDNHGTAEHHTADQEQVSNSICPVTTDEPIDPTIFVEYDGKRVYFCCNRCRKQFIEDPEAYVAGLPQFIGEEQAHSHETDHGLIDQLSTKNRVIRFAGKFHPVTVHFPIALLIAALFSELLGSIFPIQRFREAARVLVNLGAPMAAFAAALGWATGLFATYPGELEKVLSTHRWLGSATAVLALTTLAFLELYWRKQDQGLRTAYLVALTLTALFVGITGHFGGTLIHGTEHFKW